MPARGSSRCVGLLLVVAACVLSKVPVAYSQATCTERVGRIVSIQGEVQVQRARTVEWVSVKGLDVPLCIGDQIRTGLLSRAGLYVSPETVIRLDQNTTLEFVEQTSEQTVVALRREEFNRVVEKRAGQCGVGYFITRFPRKLKVRTPFYNAVVEGTEFQVAMSCDRGELAVFEGKVAAEKLDAPSERVLVEGGQSTSVDAGESPAAIKTLVRPADAVQWALYYLPLSDVRLLTEDALAQDCATLSAELRSGCAIRKAEYLLKVGRVGEARGQLDALSTAEPNNGDVLALQSIIALVQNDKGQALDLGTRATQAAPNAFRSFTALSYAQQAHFKLDAALASAQRAAQLAPASALMKARTAELLLSLGKTRAAERDAKEAVRLDPNESRAHLILGFVHLAQIDTKAAKGDFGRAIELDSTEPLARLGLGLATIREGKLAEGREQIEIAVALDPTNSLVRSYVGKAYYEENSKARDTLAATQFGLARSLDSKDPTPWFYDAILKQTQNRPVEALGDLRSSIQLNDNRAVYRSTLALDQDRAARSVRIAQTFQSLGFDRLSLQAATDSIHAAPGDASAHRFLSDSYTRVPRHEIARASELLVSKLLQPIGPMPLQPCLTDLDQLSFRSGLPHLGFSEFTQLFDRDRPNVYLTGLAGNDRKWGAETMVAGTKGRLAYGIGGCKFSDDGFRANNDYVQRAGDAFVQYAVTPSADVQFEVNHLNRDFGDLNADFDPTNFSGNARNRVRLSSARAGIHLTMNESSHLLFSLIGTLRKETNTDFLQNVFDVDVQNRQRSYQAEMQWISDISDNVRFVLGGGFDRVDTLLNVTFNDLIGPSQSVVTVDGNIDQTQAYAYLMGNIGASIDWTGGLSYESLKNNPVDSDRLNPKLGVRWKPSDNVALRVAYARHIKRYLTQNQTLEPTQVTGFNQFYDDINGTRSERLGVGIDVRVTDSLFLGAEAAKRTLSTPILTDFGFKFEPQREDTIATYAYLAMSRFMTLALEPSFEHFERARVTDTDPMVTRVDTYQVPLTARLHFPSGMSASVTLRYVNQDTDRPDNFKPALRVGRDEFMLLDASLAYRLPARMGFLSLEARNLLNTKFNYRDDNYRRSELVPALYRPETTFWARVSLYF